MGNSMAWDGRKLSMGLLTIGLHSNLQYQVPWLVVLYKNALTDLARKKCIIDLADTVGTCMTVNWTASSCIGQTRLTLTRLMAPTKTLQWTYCRRRHRFHRSRIRLPSIIRNNSSSNSRQNSQVRAQFGASYCNGPRGPSVSVCVTRKYLWY